MRPKLPKKKTNKKISLQLQSSHYKSMSKVGKVSGANMVPVSWFVTTCNTGISDV